MQLETERGDLLNEDIKLEEVRVGTWVFSQSSLTPRFCDTYLEWLRRYGAETRPVVARPVCTKKEGRERDVQAEVEQFEWCARQWFVQHAHRGDTLGSRRRQLMESRERVDVMEDKLARLETKFLQAQARQQPRVGDPQSVATAASPRIVEAALSIALGICSHIHGVAAAVSRVGGFICQHLAPAAVVAGF
jgi:hypothetical protein